MIPKAVFDIQVYQNTNAPSFAVSNQPFDLFSQTHLNEEQARSSMAHLKSKDDNKKKPKIQVSQRLASCNKQNNKRNRVYVVNKQRIKSSRSTKRQNKGVDLFENPRLPPKPERPAALSLANNAGGQKVQFANIYSMVHQQQHQ